MQARRKEADEFYASVIPRSLDPDAASVMRQALAGMLWSKQFYFFDVNRWLEEHGIEPYGQSNKIAPRKRAKASSTIARANSWARRTAAF